MERKNDLLNEREIHNLGALIGQFNRLATQTRPKVQKLKVQPLMIPREQINWLIR